MGKHPDAELSWLDLTGVDTDPLGEDYSLDLQITVRDERTGDTGVVRLQDQDAIIFCSAELDDGRRSVMPGILGAPDDVSIALAYLVYSAALNMEMADFAAKLCDIDPVTALDLILTTAATMYVEASSEDSETPDNEPRDR